MVTGWDRMIAFRQDEIAECHKRDRRHLPESEVGRFCAWNPITQKLDKTFPTLLDIHTHVLFRQDTDEGVRHFAYEIN
jgi:hypothetical protein